MQNLVSVKALFVDIVAYLFQMSFLVCLLAMQMGWLNKIRAVSICGQVSEMGFCEQI